MSTFSLPDSPAMTARSSSVDAQATARTLLALSSTITLAPMARPAARAPAGSPAPDSTASDTWSSAARSAAARFDGSVAGINRPSGVAVVGPDDRQAEGRADPEQRHEDVQRQEGGRQLFPEA